MSQLNRRSKRRPATSAIEVEEEKAMEQEFLKNEEIAAEEEIKKKRESGKRKSKRRTIDRLPVSKPGVNYGFPDRRLYMRTRKVVLEKEEELKHMEASPGAKFRLEKENDYKVFKNYHYLHGKVYDLREFYAKHPGGPNILRMTAGLPDATSVFESYHAFADRDGILKKLQKYEVLDHQEALDRAPAQLFTFEEGGFYDTVVKRVREKYGGTTGKLDESVMKNVKANKEWATKVGIQVGLNLICYLLAFIIRLPTPVAMIFAFLSGYLQIQWGFTAFHDASHFALGVRNYWANDVVTRVWGAFSLWHGRIWMSHHVALHHSYTGNPSLDPDVQHATPLVRKTPDTDVRKDLGWFKFVGDKFGMMGWAFMAVVMYVFLPGMWLGQVRVYAMYRHAKLTKDHKAKRLWGMPAYDDLRGFETKWWEYVIFAVAVLVQIQRLNPLVTFAYFVALNFFYACCIVSDHDLPESAIVNHVDFPTVHQHGKGEDSVLDWGEMQVRNTTNFANSKMNFFGTTMGNINWQIEHHLFPGMSHVHLPRVAPIVRETCEEFGIPYTTYPSLADAWVAFLITLRSVMTGKEKTVDELAKVKSLF